MGRGEGYMVGGALPNDHSNDPNDHNFGGVAYRVGYLWTFDMLSKRILTIYNEIFGLLRMCVI